MQTETLQGIIPPMVTPFRADDTLDEEAFRNDVSYLIETAGVHGLAVTGSTGEGHTLTDAEVRALTSWAVDEAAGRVPIITGIITDSTRSAIERGKAVADLGVAALQVTPVHYLFRPDDDAMLLHFDALCTGTGMPVIIYNVVPWTYLSPALLTRLIDSVEGVVGVKQSAGDMKLLADLLLLAGDRARIMSAVDALLFPSFMLGAHGAIAAILTAVPTLCLALWEACQQGDHHAAGELHRKLLVIWNAMLADNLPANTKFAMKFQGRDGGLPRAPMPPTSEAQAEAIVRALEQAGLTG